MGAKNILNLRKEKFDTKQYKKLEKCIDSFTCGLVEDGFNIIELPSDLKEMMLNLSPSNYSLVCMYIRKFIKKNKVHHILIDSNMFVPFTMELCSWSYNFLYHHDNQWFKL